MDEQKQARYDRYFMDVARRTALMSYAQKRKVGCVVVRDNHIIAAGWNGMPRGYSNDCEYLDQATGELKTRPEVIHAEANAIYWCAKTEIITQGATVYVTLSPCIHCALGLIQSGVSRVVYEELYWNAEKTGLTLLEKVGIKVDRLALPDYAMLGWKGTPSNGAVVPLKGLTIGGKPAEDVVAGFCGEGS